MHLYTAASIFISQMNIGGLFLPMNIEHVTMCGIEISLKQTYCTHTHIPSLTKTYPCAHTHTHTHTHTHSQLSIQHSRLSHTHNHRNICPCVWRETNLVYHFCSNYAWQTHLNLREHERTHSIQAVVSDKRLYSQLVYILWMFLWVSVCVCGGGGGGLSEWT